MQYVLIIIFLMLLGGCQSNNLSKLSNLELVYFSVAFVSLSAEHPELANFERKDLIERLKGLDENDMSELVESKFTFPYLIVAPAFEKDNREANLVAAIEVLEILENHGMDIFKTDNAGCSSVHMAYSFKEQEILNFLVDRYGVEKFKGNPDAKAPTCRLDASYLITRE